MSETKTDGLATAQPTILRYHAQAGEDGYTHFGSGEPGSVIIDRLIHSGPSSDPAYALEHPGEFALRLDCVADGGMTTTPGSHSFRVVSGPWPPATAATDPLPAPPTAGPMPGPPAAPSPPAGTAPLAAADRQAASAEAVAEDYDRAVDLAEREAENDRLLEARRINAAELHATNVGRIADAASREVDVLTSGKRQHAHDHTPVLQRQAEAMAEATRLLAAPPARNPLQEELFILGCVIRDGSSVTPAVSTLTTRAGALIDWWRGRHPLPKLDGNTKS